MIPLIQKEVVMNHHWLTMSQFTDIIAVAEMTPGPIAINTATFVGYKMAGIAGAGFATLGVVLPSFILIVGLASLILKYKDNRHFKNAFAGLRPIVVALVIGAALFIGKDAITSLKETILSAVALLMMIRTKLHPVLIILGFGILGIIFY